MNSFLLFRIATLILGLSVGSLCMGTPSEPSKSQDSPRAKVLLVDKVKIEVLPNIGHLKGVKGTFITDKATLGEIWAALMDYGQYSEFMPLTKKSKILKSEGSTVWVDLLLKLGFTEVNYQLKMDHKLLANVAESSWVRVSGDMVDIKGSWKLESENTYVKATYISYVDSGFFVPGWLESLLTEKSVPDLFDAVVSRAIKMAQAEGTISSQNGAQVKRL
ncbi:MAG: SRPBCC family protein [Pseudomonadota bacterium]